MPSNLLPQKQSKKVFHLYRYKKTEKLSPENQIFLKNLRAAETAPKSEKSGYIIVSNCGRSNQQ